MKLGLVLGLLCLVLRSLTKPVPPNEARFGARAPMFGAKVTHKASSPKRERAKSMNIMAQLIVKI